VASHEVISSMELINCESWQFNDENILTGTVLDFAALNC
jgi:hypothetical protein